MLCNAKANALEMKPKKNEDQKVMPSNAKFLGRKLPLEVLVEKESN